MAMNNIEAGHGLVLQNEEVHRLRFHPGPEVSLLLGRIHPPLTR